MPGPVLDVGELSNEFLPSWGLLSSGRQTDSNSKPTTDSKLTTSKRRKTYTIVYQMGIILKGQIKQNKEIVCVCWGLGAAILVRAARESCTKKGHLSEDPKERGSNPCKYL